MILTVIPAVVFLLVLFAPTIAYADPVTAGLIITGVSAVGQMVSGVIAAGASAAAAEVEAENALLIGEYNRQAAEVEAENARIMGEYNAAAAEADALALEEAAAFSARQAELETAINVQQAETEAAEATRAAGEKERLKRSENKRVLARQRALMGASGVTISGSPLLVMIESARQGNLDALAIRELGEAQAGAKLLEAEFLEFSGLSSAARTRLEGRLAAERARRGGQIDLLSAKAISSRARTSGQIALLTGQSGAQQATARASTARSRIGTSILTGASKIGGVLTQIP